MRTRVNVFVAAAALLCLVPSVVLALTPYTEDFESLNMADPGALGAAGWLVYGNVFDPSYNYLYGYGPFPAPNAGSAFCNIVSGEGGGAQGAQQLVVFSDYNNGDHANGNIIESLVYQEQPIGAGDVGETWRFDFQGKMGNLEGSSTALAFIKTLNPAAGYATTNYITIDMTTAPATWQDYSLQIVITPDLEGQLLQIGFENQATLYQGSGVFYDNLNFHIYGAVPTDDASWSDLKALYR